MPRGQPDFGAYAVKEVTASLSDMAELAARLGSIVTYDRRGEVVDFDDFESPKLIWSKSAGEETSVFVHSTSVARSGVQSIKLTTGDEDEAHIAAYRTYGILTSKVLGIEVAARISLRRCYLQVKITYYSGARQYTCECRLDLENHILAVYNDSAAYEEVADVGLLTGISGGWGNLKLVADFDTGKYKRVMFQNTEYDISDITIRSIENPAAPYVTAWLQLKNPAALGNTIWLDNYILTQAEP